MKVYISALVGATGSTVLSGFIDAFKMPLSETRKMLETVGTIIAPTSVSFSTYPDGLRMDIAYEKGPAVKADKMIEAVTKACDDLELTTGKEFALKTLNSLIDANLKIHGVTRDQLVMHDLGNPETLIYIVGMAYIYEKAKLHDADVLCSEVDVGNGRVVFDNQFYYVPNPVVKEFLQGLKWKFAKNGEMVDAVGACILRNIIKRQEDFAFFNGRVGIGYSAKTFDGQMGRTRVVIGQ